MRHGYVALLLGCLGAVPAVLAQDDATDQALALKQSGFLEFGVSYDNLSKGHSSWNSQFVRANLLLTEQDRLDLEIASQDHFDDRGTLLSAGVTHIFDEDWYGRLAFGTSSGGFFLPRWRVDASLSRKWLPQRNLVTTLGLGYYDAKDEHSDRSVSLSALYYFDAPFIVEVGARLNRSNPGSIDSERFFGAINWGMVKERFITLKYETGGEGYQLMTPQLVMTDFNSNETTLIWREWVNKDYGFNVRLQHYSNPFYDRNGLELSLFLDF
jgi:YaiO family outer membrane protein